MNEVIVEYIETLNLEDYQAIGLIGSFATNQEGKWSDVDLIAVTDQKRPNQIEIFKNRYFTISYYCTDEFETYFKDTRKMLKGIKTFSNMRIIYDPDAILENLKKKSESFKVTSVHKEHSLYRAKLEYIGYMEEAQKGLQGLIDKHNGKQLCGLYGLTHGMFQVISLRDHLYIDSDNDFYDVVMKHLDEKDPIRDIAPHAFGILPTTLEDQVEAGLELFMHVGNSLMSLFDEDEKLYGIKLIQEIIKVV